MTRFLPDGGRCLSPLFAALLCAMLLPACGGSSSSQPASGQQPDDGGGEQQDPPALSIVDATLAETAGDEPARMQFGIQLSAAHDAAVSADYAMQDQTAAAGADYVATTGTVTIPAGDTVAMVFVELIDDAEVEQTETFAIMLADAVNADIARGAATGTILDDDRAPQLTIDDAVASEGNSGADVRVSLDQAASGPVMFRFATADDTAVAGSDYVTTDGQVTLAAGETEAILNIPLIDDDTVEESEQFTVTLSEASGAEIADATAAVTITDDDEATSAESLDGEVIAEMPTFSRCDFINPEYCLFPWPNNWFTSEQAPTTNAYGTSTDRLLNLNIASMPINTAGKPIDPAEWNRNDGFSPGQMMLARVPGLDMARTGAVGLTSLETYDDAEQPVLVIDADTGERQMIWAELDANITAAASAPPTADPGPALIIRPAKNLEPGRRYIVALRNLRDAAGELLTAPPGFRIYRDNAPTSLPMVEDRRAHFEDLFATLTDAGVERGSLYLAWDFTVASERSLTERALHIRDDALATLDGGAPAFSIYANGGVIDNPLGDEHITARRIRGTLSVPCYLNTPNCVSGGTFHYLPGLEGLQGDGLPDRLTPVSSANVPFICQIQRTTYDGAADAASAISVTPAKPATYGHGLLGARDEGNTYNGNVREMASTYNIAFCMVDWAGMAIGNQPDDPDDPAKYDPAWDAAGGDLASIASILADVTNFPKLGDRVQQGLLNFIFLGRALLHEDGFCSHEAFQAAGECVLDRTELFYDGNSQGGIIGGAMIAVSPDIRAGVLGVVGMNYSTLLRRSVDFDQYAVALYNAYPASLDQSFVLSLMQNLWDRAENNGYAWSFQPGRNLPGTPEKRLLLHPAFGDHQVTITSAEVMARTIDASVHCPAVIAGSDPQSGPAVAAVPHPDVDAEADYVEAEQDGFVHPRRRHHDNHPYFGIPCVTYPHAGNALVNWDRGPRTADRDNGTVTPPVTNTPPRPELGYGGDPHGDPRSDTASMRQKDAWMTTDGALIDVCDGKPCVTRGFDPTPGQ